MHVAQKGKIFPTITKVLVIFLILSVCPGKHLGDLD